MRRVYLAIFCLAGAASLGGCEAALDLSGVAAEQTKPILRFDRFQAAAAAGQRIAAISTSGAVLISEDGTASWSRVDLPGAPALIALTGCPNGSLHALDNLHGIWTLKQGETGWNRTEIDTYESVLSISCTAANDLWVGASFATMFVSHDGGESWEEIMFDDDLQITTIDFVDAQTGFAVGEFGTFLRTTDGGATWERGSDLPNEFYPMAAEFVDPVRGWVGGLDGVFWHTNDGGETWQRGQAPSKAPIYGIAADNETVVAVGEGGTLIHLVNDEWSAIPNAPTLLAYLRGVCLLPDGDVLVAGGGGTLLRVSLIDGTTARLAQ